MCSRMLVYVLKNSNLRMQAGIDIEVADSAETREKEIEGKMSQVRCEKRHDLPLNKAEIFQLSSH